MTYFVEGGCKRSVNLSLHPLFKPMAYSDGWGTFVHSDDVSGLCVCERRMDESRNSSVSWITD